MLKFKRILFLALNSLALIFTIQSVNSTCFWFQHQPELPEAAKKYKKY